jgi:AmiR/NasT family two-component response regulator
MRERKLIDIAKGILMREIGRSLSDSHNFILKRSRDERVKAGEIARQLIVLLGTPEERKKFG